MFFAEIREREREILRRQMEGINTNSPFAGRTKAYVVCPWRSLKL
jgi:hypothetical protein